MKSFFQDGQVVLFQGDSITDCGRNRESESCLGYGYPKVVSELYKTLFPKTDVTFVNKGISGNRVLDILDRYETDVKQINPDFVSILIGINDTWRRYDSNDITTTEEFEVNYRTLLTKIKADFPECKIMMIEPFLLNSTPDRASWREDLDPKIQVVRALAKEFADYYLPLDGMFAKMEVEGYTCHQLAADGVHPEDIAHSMIGKWYLDTLM